MPLVDSKNNTTRRTYTLAELVDAARLMRGYNLVALTAAGSGHSGGTLSVMDLAAALYLHAAKLDPQNPEWPERDRIVWSTGHKAPALYVALGMAGYFPIEDVVRLRKLYSPYQGHPHWLKLPGVEVSTGSLGQGLSIAVGMARAAKMDRKNWRTYCFIGDGEMQEGQIWEALMEASAWGLDNLCCILDKNRLQIDGWVKEVMNIEPVVDKFRAFGWNVIEIDGHNMQQIVKAFDKAAATREQPTAIVANTTKGKGVAFMENIAGWHGRAPKHDELVKALEGLGLKYRIEYEKLLKKAEEYHAEAVAKLKATVPAFGRDYFWNRGEKMKVEMKPTRMGFGEALAKGGKDRRTVAIGADISGSIAISKFYECDAERCERWLSVGIAEQSGTCVAAGLAREGKIPVFGTYGVFAAGRNLDQLRTTVAYGNLNVLIAGAHGGVSVGPDGATHQALEDLFQICGLPGMNVSVPCDALETERATEHLLFNITGPKYIRFAREATPVVTRPDTPFVWGEPNVYRYRGEKPNFIDAFECKLANEYDSENEDLTIIACGPMVPEAMRAAWILKEEHGVETRVLNYHTLKPFVPDQAIRAAAETGIIITAEEHQVGGLANWVSHHLHAAPELYGVPVAFGAIGVKDRFGESGEPWELMWEFEVSGEHIAARAKELYDFVQGRKAAPAPKKPAPKKPAAKKPAAKKPAAKKTPKKAAAGGTE